MGKSIIFDLKLQMRLIACLPKSLIICQLELDILNVILDKNFTVNRLFNLLISFRSYNDISEVTEPSVPGIPRSTEGGGKRRTFHRHALRT